MTAGRPVRFRSLRFGLLEAVVLGALALGALTIWRPWRASGEATLREQAALESARAVVAAERELRRRGAVDRDGDGTSEFGTLEDLARAGLAPPAAPEGYAIDVLLPGAALRDDRRALVVGAEGVDAQAASRSFVVVARPLDRAAGLRSYYLDGAGALYAIEGVVDAQGLERPPLPTSTLRGAVDSSQDGPIWRLVEPKR